MKKFCLYFSLNLLISLFAIADSSTNSAVTIQLSGKLSDNLACTLQCGNCCTGQTIDDSSASLNLNIGYSDIDLSTFYNDGKLHWIKGYFYQAKGSCDSGSCSLLHITSIDTSEQALFQSQTGILTLPIVNSDGQAYSATLSGPYSIDKVVEVVGQSQDCSQGQQCAEGYQCITYSGIAGNTLKSCELPCIDNQYCPFGKSCLNIADGPQNICQ